MKVSVDKKAFIAAVLCVGVLVVVFVYAYAFPTRKAPPSFNINTTEGAEQARNFWKNEIARVGGKVAYAELLAAYATSSPGTQHTAAHIFGGSLYAQEGEAGLAACDTSFSFGCFHEFLGRAIEAQGLSGVNTLNEGCYRALGPGKSLSCAHGLGHGIQSYLGYDLESLKKALVICKNLPHGDPIGGCPGGLFMEYNMRSMSSLFGMSMRIEDDGGIMYPCDRLDAPDKPLCYYWQPQWWSQLFKGKAMSAKDTFKKIGDLCRTLPSVSQKRCFEGAGTVVGISAAYDVKDGAALCAIAATTEDARGACLTSAAGSYYAEESSRALAPKLCEGLSDPWVKKCTAGATGSTVINGVVEEMQKL